MHGAKKHEFQITFAVNVNFKNRMRGSVICRNGNCCCCSKHLVLRSLFRKKEADKLAVADTVV